jgi:hypothetical protein
MPEITPLSSKSAAPFFNISLLLVMARSSSAPQIQAFKALGVCLLSTGHRQVAEACAV